MGGGVRIFFKISVKTLVSSYCNILYVDSDTIFYDDVQCLFDTYCYYDVYGREEFGFRYDPNSPWFFPEKVTYLVEGNDNEILPASIF